MSNLLIKLNATDTGARDLPPGSAFWACEGIKLLGEKQDLYGYGATAVGRETRVRVDVTNTAAPAIHQVNIQAWVCNFVIGYVGPGSKIAGTPSFTGFVTSIPGNSTVEVPMAPLWTPTEAQMQVNLEGEGADRYAHLCVGANVYGETPVGIPIGGSLDIGGVDPVRRSEHGWRNIRVFLVKRTSEPRPSQGVVLANLDEDRARVFTVTVSASSLLTATDMTHILSGPFAEHRFQRSPLPPLAMDIGVRPEPLETPESILDGREVVRFGKHPRPVRKEFKLRPKQQRKLFFKARLSSQEAPGNVQPFDVLTQDEDGTIIGGARLLALVDK
jgi:hypothetical protein